MPYITSFTYCDFIQTEPTPQGLVHRIMNPLQILSPISIPGNYSFSIACNVSGFNHKEENRVRVVFESESGEIVKDTGDIPYVLPPEEAGKNVPAMMQFNLDFRNLILKEVGTYTTKIYVNNEQLGDYKIPVIIGA